MWWTWALNRARLTGMMEYETRTRSQTRSVLLLQKRSSGEKRMRGLDKADRRMGRVVVVGQGKAGDETQSDRWRDIWKAMQCSDHDAAMQRCRQSKYSSRTVVRCRGPSHRSLISS